VIGFLYLRALQRLGLKYRHETFEERKAVEGFRIFKLGRRGSGTDFRSGVLLNLFKVGWIVLLLSIIGVCLDNLMSDTLINIIS